MTQVAYKQAEKLRLYRTLLKGAFRFPLKSRRDVVTEEVRATFRDPSNELLADADIDYTLILGWERSHAVSKYAENMYWFHSRDEVTKEMMHHSVERDRRRAQEMARCIAVGQAGVKTKEVTEFKSTYFNVHPDYAHKLGTKPLENARDIWRTRGSYGSDTGGPRQKFYVRRFKPLFPQGW